MRLAGDALDRCGRRVQLAVHGHRGFKDDPLYKSRRTLHTGAGLLTDRQVERLRTPSPGISRRGRGDLGHLPAQARCLPPARPESGRTLITKLIADLISGVPKALVELITLGRTLKKRAADVLAHFGRPGTSNGTGRGAQRPTRTLRGSALGFADLADYIARSLLEPGGFRTQLHPRLR